MAQNLYIAWGLCAYILCPWCVFVLGSGGGRAAAAGATCAMQPSIKTMKPMPRNGDRAFCARVQIMNLQQQHMGLLLVARASVRCLGAMSAHEM